MKEIDKDGLILCEIQAKAFELSYSRTASSSEIFIRRFMNSKIAADMDSPSFMQTGISENDIIDLVNEEYGISDYGSVKYTENELFWTGYIYRYFSYTYGISSKKAYRTVKPGELRGLFAAYHTLDPSAAIERILEAKNPEGENEEERQFRIFKKIREGK